MAEKTHAESASAFGLQIQLMGIYSDLLQYREHLGQSRVAHRAQRGVGFRAQLHQGFAGEQQRVHFRVEDLQALASYGSEPLLNLIGDLDRRFNGVVDAMNIYRATWLEMASSMAGRVVGPVIQMSLNEEEIRRIEPKLAAQTKLLTELDQMVAELVPDTFNSLVGLYQARVKSFGLEKNFEAIDPQNRYVVIRPDPGATPPGPKPLAEK